MFFYLVDIIYLSFPESFPVYLEMLVAAIALLLYLFTVRTHGAFRLTTTTSSL